MKRARPKVVRSLVKNALGPLEERVLRLVCVSGCCTVRDVVHALEKRNVAYTTVMTTMDRLYQKGLLTRQTNMKAYTYSSALTLPQMEAQLARDLLAAFLNCRTANSGLLAAALVDLLDAFRPDLLREVENAIRSRRDKREFKERFTMPWTQNLLDSIPLGNA